MPKVPKIKECAFDATDFDFFSEPEPRTNNLVVTGYQLARRRRTTTLDTL